MDAAREVVRSSATPRWASWGRDGTSPVEFVTSGIDEAARQRIGDLPRGHGLLGAVIRRETDPPSDINQHPLRASGFPPHHPPMTSFLGVPGQRTGGVFGNLYPHGKSDAAEFSDEDETIAAVAIDRPPVGRERPPARRKRAAPGPDPGDAAPAGPVLCDDEPRAAQRARPGVYGWAERLRAAEVARDLPIRRRARCTEAADRTIVLLNNFLDLMRLDAGKVRPVLRDVETRAAVQRAIASSEPAAAGEGNPRLESSFGGAPEMLHTDPVRLDQIPVNLLSNAIRHSPERAYDPGSRRSNGGPGLLFPSSIMVREVRGELRGQNLRAVRAV